MNDAEVERQIHQMVAFIKQEAEEKASEIRVTAEEEFNIEKLQMVEEERRRIKKEYERKESQAEVREKIEFSTQLNAMRLKILHARDEAAGGCSREPARIWRGSRRRPSTARCSWGSSSRACRSWRPTPRSCDAASATSRRSRWRWRRPRGKPPGLKLALDEHAHLPPPPGPDNGDGASCIGGVHVISMDGKITCNNSLDDRLKVAFERNLPELREAVFGANPNVAASN